MNENFANQCWYIIRDFIWEQLRRIASLVKLFVTISNVLYATVRFVRQDKRVVKCNEWECNYLLSRFVAKLVRTKLTMVSSRPIFLAKNTEYYKETLERWIKLILFRGILMVSIVYGENKIVESKIAEQLVYRKFGDVHYIWINLA